MSIEHLASQAPVPFLDLLADPPKQRVEGLRVARSRIAAIAPTAVALLLRQLP